MLTAAAPAKLNLTLHITGKRADGYHMLESLVVFTSALADRLSAKPAKHVSLTVSGPFAQTSGDSENNLVVKAARALQKHTGCALGADITLEKNIPVGAGLGGGSSDAATALLLLNQLWETNLDRASLHEMALALGADVPMFLHGKALIARGIGEEIMPFVALPALHAVLVYPNKPLATAEVYRAFSMPGVTRPLISSSLHRQGSRVTGAAGSGERRPEIPAFSGMTKKNGWLHYVCNDGSNDLQHAAITLMADIAEILLELETGLPTPEIARMTGSGACCFALYRDEQQAVRRAEALRASHPHWWVKSTAVG
jgi:4-diphosphocytidyl-2-C-methyl-D-erythritol kinase